MTATNETISLRLAARLMDNGYAADFLPGIRELSHRAVQEFRLFLNEPGEVKDYWTLPIKQDEKKDYLGYVQRGTGGESSQGYESFKGQVKQDKKSWFHWGLLLPGNLKRNNVEVHPHEGLLTASEALWHCFNDYFMKFLSVFDGVYGSQFSPVARHISSQEMSVVRLIYYDPVPKGRVMGEGHEDRSFLTVHGADSYPGLRFGVHWQLWKPQPDEVLVFPGEKMESAVRGRIKALKHGVVQEYDNRESRWTSVFFAHINQALLRS